MAELIYHILIERQLRKGGTNEILYKEISTVLLQGCLPWGSSNNDRWHQAWPPDTSASSLLPRGAALQCIISSDYFLITGVMKVSSSCTCLSSGNKATGGVLHILCNEEFIGHWWDTPSSEGKGRRAHFCLFLPWLQRSRPRSPSSSADSTFTQDSLATTQRSLLNIWFSNALREVGSFPLHWGKHVRT